ncbi:MAG: hypothetical protein NVS3B16_18940 [Vulcanimicrobiaceae bacterium]
MSIVFASLLALVQVIAAASGAQCGAHRNGDFGLTCPTPVKAHVPAGCAVTDAQRRTIERYYGRTSLHHRAQLRYAFPHDAGGESLLAIFVQKPVSGAANSYEVVNPPDAQSDGLVYERCGNLVHAGAPYGI